MTPTAAVDPQLFARYVPLNALRPESQRDLARKSALLSLRSGDYAFRAGDDAAQALYLVDGELQLEDPAGKPLTRLRAGDPASAHRIAHQSPRAVSARCGKDAQILAVDASLLDVMLTWDQTGSFVVGDVGNGAAGGGDEDWMTRLLQTKTFQLVPPANLQAMFMRMQKVAVAPGQVIVKQGTPGDYFYVIVEGRCIVTREQPNQKPVRLAELEVGASFGEEALIAEESRNASVTALTRVTLMRLAQDDFRKLLNEPLERRLPLAEAQKLIDGGRARWLDVRLPSEFQNHHLPGAVNVPLYMLRMKLGALDPKTTWILCCDTTRRSSVGAFVLTQKGYEAYVLDKGVAPPR